jgi:hypothetical protein
LCSAHLYGNRIFQLEWSGVRPILWKKLSRLGHVIRLSTDHDLVHYNTVQK